MASPKTYVNIQKMAIKDVFDPKYKSSLPAMLQKAVEKAVKASGKLTLDEPKGKDAKGFTLDGSLVSLGPDRTGKKLSGEFSMAISTWPGHSIKAMPTGKASLEIADGANIDPGDVQALAEALAEGAMREAIKYMEKNAP